MSAFKLKHTYNPEFYSTTKYLIGTANICRNLQLRRGLVLRYSFGSGRGATVEFTASLAVNLCLRTKSVHDREDMNVLLMPCVKQRADRISPSTTYLFTTYSNHL